MIVDDSPLMRKLLSNVLSEDPQIEVVGSAPNGKIALDKIGALRPDVITMDVQMPVMDGIETLTRIMIQKPTPVIMISAYTEEGANLTFKALELGAVDFITKPDAIFARPIVDIRDEIIMKIKTANKINVKRLGKDKEEELEERETKAREEKKAREERKEKAEHEVSLEKCRKIVSIGVSTGGPEALKEIIPHLPPHIDAGILIVQHMPPGFTNAFAQRLDTISDIEVKEAQEGDIIMPGRILIAKGDYHLKIKEEKFAYITRITHEERVKLFRPSIDVMMMSTAEHFQNRTIGLIMTGMASDGVDGIRVIKEKGGITLAQDEKTSVVFGMNKLAIESGYVDRIVGLKEIVPVLMNLIEKL